MTGQGVETGSKKKINLLKLKHAAYRHGNHDVKGVSMATYIQAINIPHLIFLTAQIQK